MTTALSPAKQIAVVLSNTDKNNDALPELRSDRRACHAHDALQFIDCSRGSTASKQDTVQVGVAPDTGKHCFSGLVPVLGCLRSLLQHVILQTIKPG